MVGLWYGMGCIGWGKREGMRAGRDGQGLGYGWVGVRVGPVYVVGMRAGIGVRDGVGQEGRDEGRVGRDWGGCFGVR